MVLDAQVIKLSSIGTPKTVNFLFVPNGKLMVFGVPMFKLFVVVYIQDHFNSHICLNKALMGKEKMLS